MCVKPTIHEGLKVFRRVVRPCVHRAFVVCKAAITIAYNVCTDSLLVRRTSRNIDPSLSGGWIIVQDRRVLHLLVARQKGVLRLVCAESISHTVEKEPLASIGDSAATHDRQSVHLALLEFA